MSETFLSIVIPSYLGTYEGAATNRLAKLHRAVCSVISAFPGRAREIVIVSDGCEQTDAYWHGLRKHYNGAGDEARLGPQLAARFVRIEREGRFAGRTRNAGIEAASGTVIAYLDSDDYVLPHHFELIEQNFDALDWIWFDDICYPDMPRKASLKYGHIGTSCIAHRRALPVRWTGEYGHDWRLVEDLIACSENYRYIGDGGYVVCHIPNKLDV